MKVTPHNNVAQSLRLSSHYAHLNTSTCDLRPPRDDRQPPHAGAISQALPHCLRLTTSCSVHPCSARFGPLQESHITCIMASKDMQPGVRRQYAMGPVALSGSYMY